MLGQPISRPIRFHRAGHVSLAPVVVGLSVCIALVGGQRNASAQQTSQKFVVHVPAKAAVVAPGGVSITHDASDSPQVFPGQPWSISGNAPSGTVAEFSVDQAFTHQTQPLLNSDAELSLRIGQTGGPARWTATRAIDATSVAEGDQRAVVQVVSDAAGSARVDLGVRFLPNGEPATGQYSITVSCTITVQ